MGSLIAMASGLLGHRINIGSPSRAPASIDCCCMISCRATSGSGHHLQHVQAAPSAEHVHRTPASSDDALEPRTMLLLLVDACRLLLSSAIPELG